MKARLVLALTMVVAISSLGLLWRGSLDVEPGVHVAILRDRSGSHAGDCDAAVTLVAEALDRIGLARNATLTLFVTGDARSADEPIEVGLPALPVPSRKSIEGRGSDWERRTLYMREAAAQCARAGSANRSPIFQAVMRVVEHVKRDGTDAARRIVLVQSDLEELSHSAIRDALKAADTRAMASLPVIDNDGVDVFVCGLAETKGLASLPDGAVVPLTRARRQADAHRQRVVWSAVFARPERVHFAPFCPRLPRGLTAFESAAPSQATAAEPVLIGDYR